MKSVLISIQPKWCELIASGKKTIEVRKTAPKLQTPFKCYIYETKNTKGVHGFTILGRCRVGKVIGEFVCDRIDKYENEYWDDKTFARICKSYYAAPDDWECEEEFEYITGNEEENPDDCDLCKETCLTYEEICSYVGMGFKTFYGWHIADLKIYDKPKELGEFYTICRHKECNSCKYKSFDYGYGGSKDLVCTVSGKIPLTCPPQSYCYVEEL